MSLLRGGYEMDVGKIYTGNRVRENSERVRGLSGMRLSETVVELARTFVATVRLEISPPLTVELAVPSKRPVDELPKKARRRMGVRWFESCAGRYR